MPLIHLFFDLTLNGGWNFTAMAIYTITAALIGLAIYERG